MIRTIMRCIYRTLIVVFALSAASIGWGDEAAVERLPSTAPAAVWPTLQWKKAAPSPFARVEAPSAVVDGKLYLFGGFVTGLGASNEVDVYDPASDSWKRLNDMPTRVTHLNPAIDRGSIWFAG